MEICDDVRRKKKFLLTTHKLANLAKVKGKYTKRRNIVHYGCDFHNQWLEFFVAIVVKHLNTIVFWQLDRQVFSTIEKLVYERVPFTWETRKFLVVLSQLVVKERQCFNWNLLSSYKYINAIRGSVFKCSYMHTLHIPNLCSNRSNQKHFLCMSTNELEIELCISRLMLLMVLSTLWRTCTYIFFSYSIEIHIENSTAYTYIRTIKSEQTIVRQATTCLNESNWWWR